NLEDSDQLGDLEKIANPLREIGQFDRASGSMRGGEERNQGSQPAGIDVVDAAEIEDDTVVFGDQFPHRVAKHGRLFPEHHASMTVDDQNAVHGPSTDSELHRKPP